MPIQLLFLEWDIFTLPSGHKQDGLCLSPHVELDPLSSPQCPHKTPETNAQTSLAALKFPSMGYNTHTSRKQIRDQDHRAGTQELLCNGSNE